MSKELDSDIKLQRKVRDAWNNDSNKQMQSVAKKSIPGKDVPNHLRHVFHCTGIDPREVDMRVFREYRGKTSVRVSFDDSIELRRHLLKIMVLREVSARALKIQCAFRSMLARRIYKRKLDLKNAIIMEQKNKERREKELIRRAKQRAIQIENACVCIQCFFRTMKALAEVRKRRQKKLAIIKIQCFFRKTKANMIVHAIRNRLLAAVQIQCWYRCIVAILHVRYLRVQKNAAIQIQSLARKVAAKNRTASLRVRHKAAIVIQCFCRRIRAIATVRARREEARTCYPERSLQLIIAEQEDDGLDEVRR